MKSQKCLFIFKMTKWHELFDEFNTELFNMLNQVFTELTNRVHVDPDQLGHDMAPSTIYVFVSFIAT